MARAIHKGLADSGVNVTLRRAMDGINIKELQSMDAVILGSPTNNQEIIPLIKEFLLQMSKEDFKNKIGAAFGSCGWAGEGVDAMIETMGRSYGMDVIKPGLKVMYTPDEEGLEKCANFGKKIAAMIEKRKTRINRAGKRLWRPRPDFIKSFKSTVLKRLPERIRSRFTSNK
jgi:flavorubredoxin